jgi:ribonuclease T1
LVAVPAGERAEVRATLRRIGAGGPFLHRRDGIAFANRERLLPPEPPGYYREYTVETPGAADRGARRVVVGQEGEAFYSHDHYRTFLPLGHALGAAP